MKLYINKFMRIWISAFETVMILPIRECRLKIGVDLGSAQLSSS